LPSNNNIKQQHRVLNEAQHHLEQQHHHTQNCRQLPSYKNTEQQHREIKLAVATSRALALPKNGHQLANSSSKEHQHRVIK
jgi:hypothetical protein